MKKIIPTIVLTKPILNIIAAISETKIVRIPMGTSIKIVNTSKHISMRLGLNTSRMKLFILSI